MAHQSSPSVPMRRLIDVSPRPDLAGVTLRVRQMDEKQLHDLGDEILNLARQEGYRKIALSLGKPSPVCLYSVFLGLLVRLRRELAGLGCTLLLCDVTPEVRDIFAATRMESLFVFVEDFDAACVHQAP